MAIKYSEEWNIIYISQLIREKPEWKRKCKDISIVAKWKSEIESQFRDKTNYFEEIWDYTMKELEWYIRIERNFPGFEKNGFTIGCDDKVVFSDTVVDSKTKEKLATCVSNFVNHEFKDTDPDYHPGSNDQVVDIVHPSLYPLQYGVTPYNATRNEKCMSIIQLDESVGKCKYGADTWAQSESFLWLPALMSFPKDSWNSTAYQFQSYINNLHPKYEDLYHVIEDVFNSAVPGLNFVLSRYKTKPFNRIPVTNSSYYTEEWDEKTNEYWEREDQENSSNDEYETFYAQRVNYLKPLTINYEQDPPVDYTFDLRDTFGYLKVIVKLANIELTPEKPFYAGGTWHIEGTINEDIVATILYYYDCDNITESRLTFRSTFEDPDYVQGDTIALEKLFGLKDGDIMNRIVGDIECREGRLLLFPNGFQHKVELFSLEDKTRAGHRKILCIFLVDPYNDKVVTTAQVPPQQPSWHEQDKIDEPLREQYLKERAELDVNNEFFNPPEKWDMLQFFGSKWRHEVDELKNRDGKGTWPMSLDEAKEIRKKLMEERKVPEDPEDDLAFTRGFALCEH